MQGPPNKRKKFIGNRVALIQVETSSGSWRYEPSQSTSANFISSGIEPTKLSTFILWWKGTQWLSQEPCSWPKTEINTHRQIGNKKYAICMSTTSRRYDTHIIQVGQIDQSNCILQVIHKQLQKYQGHQEINYPLHAKY